MVNAFCIRHADFRMDFITLRVPPWNLKWGGTVELWLLKGELLFSSVGPLKLIYGHWLRSSRKCTIIWLNIGLRVYLDLYVPDLLFSILVLFSQKHPLLEVFLLLKTPKNCKNRLWPKKYICNMSLEKFKSLSSSE